MSAIISNMQPQSHTHTRIRAHTKCTHSEKNNVFMIFVYVWNGMIVLPSQCVYSLKEDFSELISS